MKNQKIFLALLAAFVIAIAICILAFVHDKSYYPSVPTEVSPEKKQKEVPGRREPISPIPGAPCRNLCGNGKCESEFECDGPDCPCFEDEATCPEDCGPVPS
jgi:hypothetical protein